MRNLSVVLLLLITSITHGQTEQEIKNITAFNKLYGCVRYFHPSDEAANLDWEKFAIYGTSKVLTCKDAQSLRKTLSELFEPIAPTVIITANGEKTVFSSESITPPDTTGFTVVTWQHQGLGNGTAGKLYQSGRTNRPVSSSASQYSTIRTSVDVSKFQNKRFVFSATVRLVEGPGTAHLWARIEQPDLRTAFFDNMTDRPITSRDWSHYEISGTIDPAAARIHFGCYLLGQGKLIVDDLVLKVGDGKKWKTIYDNSFEKDEPNSFPTGLSGTTEAEYKTAVTVEAASGGKRGVSIESTDVIRPFKPPFAERSQPGAYYEKDLGSGLSAIIPLALYGTRTNTWPSGNPEKLRELKTNLENTKNDPNGDVDVRLGGIVITWNVFQHFYPYFDIVKTDWESAFTIAIQKAFHDESADDYQNTLRRLTARLRDGHANVHKIAMNSNPSYFPPITWEWIENKLVITNVANSNVGLRPGDIVTEIDGRPAESFFNELYPAISAATPGWLHFRANTSSLLGTQNSSLTLKLLDSNGVEKQVPVERNLSDRDFHSLLQDSGAPIRQLTDGIHYVNLSTASMSQINDQMSHLQKAKTIIFDLRGYPKSNHEIISHLLHDNDTSRRWMRVPRIIYPDQQHVSGWAEMGWKMKPKKPHLGAKIFFLLDGRAISYAESFMSFIEHYNLGTIIGQPSAGTNGNVNRFRVPGGFEITWTGMKVFKHDGTPLHGVGILPDVYVEKTINGVREQRDEFLEKAIELATQFHNQSR